MKDNWLRLTTGFRLFERHSGVKDDKCISELQVAELEFVYCAHPLPRKYCQKGTGVGNPRPHFSERPGIK